MRTSFLLLPFFLYLGVSGQAIGLYLFAVIIPFFAIKDEHNEGQRSVTLFATVGFFLLLIYSVFPISNLLNSFVTPGDLVRETPIPAEFKYKKLFESRFSSAVLATSLSLLLIASYFRKKLNVPKEISDKVTPEQLLTYFTKGMFWASILIGLYALTQNITGFDYRAAGHTLDVQHKMGNGLYRAFGLYGHPLSLAGVGAAVFGFFWTFLWNDLSKGSTNKKLSFQYGLICLVNLFLVFASGGRTATVALLLIFVFIPFTVKLPPSVAKLRTGFLALGASVTIAFLFLGGVTSRFAQFFSGADGDRFKFWKVHWTMFLDKIWIGQGSAWSDGFRRVEYYNRLGFEGMRDKFQAHNIFLETLAGVGILGSAVILFALFKLFGKLKQQTSSQPVSKACFTAFSVSVVANLIHGLTQNTFFDSNVMISHLALLWLLLWMSFVSDAHA